MSQRIDTLLLDATDESITADVAGCAGIGLQLAGTWSGTVSFEATIDGVTWVALNMVPSNSPTAASSATSNGAWSTNAGGYAAIRARFSTATSGTVKATMQVSNGSGRF